jgi:hypothetical protein
LAFYVRALAIGLAPRLFDAVHAEVVAVDATDLESAFLVTLPQTRALHCRALGLTLGTTLPSASATMVFTAECDNLGDPGARRSTVSESDWRQNPFLDQPNVARMWDYYLGGYHNFAVDRDAAELAIKLYPDMPLVAQLTRGFLRRAVGFLLDQGIEQFLDIGSGMPTAGNVHEVAQRVNPATRVVYVDSDPVVIAHANSILRETPQAVALQADARRPEQIVGHPDVRRTLDWTRPLGILTIALFHFMRDDADVLRIMNVLRDAVPAGSYFVLTHATADAVGPELARAGEENYQRANLSLQFRTRDRVARFFEGLDLVEPGLVYLPQWRPDMNDDVRIQPERSANYAGVGLKR